MGDRMFRVFHHEHTSKHFCSVNNDGGSLHERHIERLPFIGQSVGDAVSRPTLNTNLK